MVRSESSQIIDVNDVSVVMSAVSRECVWRNAACGGGWWWVVAALGGCETAD